ncbi:MAG: hypothetical protein D8M57_16675 [Candidatus Scalindua sp. AMX11]|nr:MAG: hypothetical protein DWQ00_06690 [Candidatus Scalindua sp.]NOG84247.1 hypothetical protein [Planctomycetota bacterium]RZV68280.1 MAG: hypothetical protein EX341_16550 [Candidatus Scalindua sp. SCAELEC01]TDE63774.1 MAG: hypothetical protein D8M57_16675 [Candidatus Scalindua sp. AMX11]GJQ60728.1 MAG: hypothetical protein SCALA701_35290 [Candidatus Scalindua sp.]
MKKTITHDQDIRLTIIEYKDRLNKIVTLAYLCLEKDRQDNGNFVDNGKLLVSVDKKEMYRIPFKGTFTEERSTALTKHLNEIVNQGKAGEVLWGHIENKVLRCCGSCYAI